MTIFRGATIGSWFNVQDSEGRFPIERITADPAGVPSSAAIVVNRGDNYSNFSSVFDAVSRDRYIEAPEPVTITVESPNNPDNTATLGTKPFGIGIKTPGLAPGVDGIATQAEEIAYYPQLESTGDAADSLTIEFNRDYLTTGRDSGIVLSFLYAIENLRPEKLRYELWNNDGTSESLVHTAVIVAQDNGSFSTVGGLKAGLYHYRFSDDPILSEEPVVFDKVVITGVNGLQPDGTDGLLEAIIANDVGPSIPAEDPDPIPTPGLINFHPTSNPSPFNFRGGGDGAVPAAIMGSDSLNVTDVVQSSVRLAFSYDELLAGNGVAPTRFNNPELINGDSFPDLQFFFGSADLRGIKNQILPDTDPNNVPLFIYFETTNGQSFVGVNPSDDPVKAPGGF